VFIPGIGDMEIVGPDVICVPLADKFAKEFGRDMLCAVTLTTW